MLSPKLGYKIQPKLYNSLFDIYVESEGDYSRIKGSFESTSRNARMLEVSEIEDEVAKMTFTPTIISHN